MNQIKSVDTVIWLCWSVGFCPAHSQFNPWSLSLHCIKNRSCSVTKNSLNILNCAGSSKTNHAYHRLLAIQSPSWKPIEIHFCPVKAIGQGKWFYATNYSAPPRLTHVSDSLSHDHQYLIITPLHSRRKNPHNPTVYAQRPTIREPLKLVLILSLV